ncbi:MAG: ABC transporter permease subunit, partial [Alphaproteobacteria bacterium]|nr:ABC transporter permease subunit [Alphaproteobacteria bacterium]
MCIRDSHLPGVGRLVAAAALNRDYPVVQGVVLLLAAAVIVLNLVIDILVAVADPRLRHGARTSS